MTATALGSYSGELSHTHSGKRIEVRTSKSTTLTVEPREALLRSLQTINRLVMSLDFHIRATGALDRLRCGYSRFPEMTEARFSLLNRMVVQRVID